MKRGKSPQKLGKNDDELVYDQEIPLKILREWSGKNEINTLFNSNIHDCDKKSFERYIINKNNLYFIHADNQNNVFGGYLSSKLNKTDEWINDSNSFVFSLIRNGKVNNKKYVIQSEESENAFILWSSDGNEDPNFLYSFGNNSDIGVYKINNDNSYCYPMAYSYGDDDEPLVGINQSHFSIKQIIVIQMSDVSV
ncbi:TLDc domain-containing protein [Entamoeba marina]